MQQICIIKLGALGDIAQSFGLIKAIRAHYAPARITVLTRKNFHGFIAACPYVDDVRTSNFATTLRNADMVFDLQNNKRTAKWAFANWLLWRRPWVGTTFFAAQRACPNYTTQQAFYADAEILRLAHIPAPTPDDYGWMQASQNFALPAPYALIVPGCSPEHPEKRWPVDGFVAVCAWLAARNITPVILGGSSEEAIANRILAAVPQAVSLVQKTKITDIPPLARLAVCAVGNDTGPMHLAGPTGCKTLVLFGDGRDKLGSNPVRHRPLGRHVHVLQNSPLQSLPPEQVTEKLAQMLAAT